MVFKDFINGLVIISLIFILSILITKKELLKFYVDDIVLLLPLFALGISMYSLLFFFDIATYKDFLINNSITEPRNLESTQIDYNFTLIPVFFGFISALFLMIKNQKKYLQICLNIILLIFSLQILSSGSRRGLFIYLSLILFLIFIQTLRLRRENSILKLLAQKSFIFLSLLFFLIFTTYIITLRTPYFYKNHFLEFIGSKNILITKDKITQKVMRYISIIDKSTTYKKIYNALWTPSFNPKDPDSSWGTRIHKSIFPLTGKNIEIVPSGIKGYQLDWSCNPSYYEGIDICESFSLITELKASDGDSFTSSVFCFVTEDFDGTSVTLSVDSRVITEKLVSGNLYANYNLQKRGEWQKLEINFTAKNGDIPIYISFLKNGVKDFSKLRGSVIFAFPQYQLVNSKKLSNSFSSCQIHSILEYNRCTKVDRLNSHLRYTLDNTLPVQNLSFILPNEIDSGKIKNQPFLNNSVHRMLSPSGYYPAGMMSFPLNVLIGQESPLIHEDPLRNWIAKLVSEDTTYQAPKSDIIVNKIQYSFTGDRTERWKFALIIFSKEFNWRQKIFGGGFNFLNWYGYYFLNDKTKSDYPHNPFLYILLYSGIFGLLLYIILLYKVFYYYFKYIKEYHLFFVFFLITYFFTFFSGGSPFDPPIMGFFIIMPFFIHSIQKNPKNDMKDVFI